MNNLCFSVPRFFVFIFSFILISSTVTQAQSVKPDELIKSQMMAYVAQAENALALSRPRIVPKTGFAGIGDAKDNAKKSKPPVKETSSFERAAFEIINERRIANGLEPLEWSEDMARVARLHSENMAFNKFFSHTGLDGSLVSTRADALGVSNWRSIGENIAYNRGFKKPVESACEQWMNSRSHRENILDKRWKEAGVGMAIAPDGTYYFTQVFILK